MIHCHSHDEQPCYGKPGIHRERIAMCQGGGVSSKTTTHSAPKLGHQRPQSFPHMEKLYKRFSISTFVPFWTKFSKLVLPCLSVRTAMAGEPVRLADNNIIIQKPKKHGYWFFVLILYGWQKIDYLQDSSSILDTFRCEVSLLIWHTISCLDLECCLAHWKINMWIIWIINLHDNVWYCAKVIFFILDKV